MNSRYDDPDSFPFLYNKNDGNRIRYTYTLHGSTSIEYDGFSRIQNYEFGNIPDIESEEMQKDIRHRLFKMTPA